MACDCNTPTSSGGNTAPTERAYLTNPVTAPAESCYTPPENPCAVPVSRRRYLVDFIPGWLHRLTGAAKGKMLVAVGDTLHFFKGDQPGPLYFDGHDVSVGEQSTLTTKADDAAIVEKGFLTLAKKVRRGKVLPNGSVVDVDYFEHGVQSVREISSGEMVGLTSDPASGSVRLDVIEPTQRDLVKKGIPANMRRLGFVETLIDGACGKIPAKEFLSYRGGVYGEDEILADYEKGGLPAILIPRNDGGQKTHVLGTQKFKPVEGVTAESLEDAGYRIPVIKPVYGDAGCPEKVTGYITEYIPFPAILTSDYDAGNVGRWVPCVPTLLGSWTDDSAGVIDVSSIIDVPAGAYAASVECFVKISGSGLERIAALTVFDVGRFDGEDPQPSEWYVRARTVIGTSGYGDDSSIGPCPLNANMELEYHFYAGTPGCVGELRVTGFYV